MTNPEISELIGQLEILATSVEPGVVISEEMCMVSCNVLLKTIHELRNIKKINSNPLLT